VNIRVFDDATKKSVYAAQTAKAQTTGKSNCPYCAMSEVAKHYNFVKSVDVEAMESYRK